MSFTNDKDSDNYATDKKGWELIKEYIPTDKQIWSPFYCDGKQKEYFAELGFDIIHNDEDFFENDRGEIVIDNPPFSKMKEICKRLKELEKPDRKSTRLNSSHGYISYAVFCLKKKKVLIRIYYRNSQLKTSKHTCFLCQLLCNYSLTMSEQTTMHT